MKPSESTRWLSTLKIVFQGYIRGFVFDEVDEKPALSTYLL